MREAAAKRRPKPLLMLTQPESETLALQIKNSLIPRTLKTNVLSSYTLSQCVVSLQRHLAVSALMCYVCVCLCFCTLYSPFLMRTGTLMFCLHAIDICLYINKSDRYKVISCWCYLYLKDAWLVCQYISMLPYIYQEATLIEIIWTSIQVDWISNQCTFAHYVCKSAA